MPFFKLIKIIINFNISLYFCSKVCINFNVANTYLFEKKIILQKYNYDKYSILFTYLYF